MLIEELQKQTELLAEQNRLLKESVKRPDDRALKVLAAIGPIISGLLIAGVGWYFTSTYNKQQIDLAQIQLLEKFDTQLLSEKPAERRMALAALMSLGNEDLAIRTAAALPPEDRNALLSDLFNVGVATDDYDVLRRTLRIVKPLQLGTDPYGRTPLLIAVDNNDPTMLTFLLRQRFEPNFITQQGTPLIEAATLGHTECVRLLLANGANPALILGQERMTALHHAVDKGHVETVNELLQDKRVDVNARDAKGRDPLLIAVGFRMLDRSYPATRIVQALLAHGANPKTTEEIGRSALILAIENDYDDAFKLLYDAGAPLVSGPTSMNALHEAVHFGRDEVVKYLLSKGVSPNIRDEYGDTPLHNITEDATVVRTLTKGGADPNAATKDGQTVLVTALETPIYGGATGPARASMLASHEEHMIPIVQALLDAKADPNKRSRGGKLPLGVAATTQRVEVLHALLRAGAHLNDLSGDEQETPLIAAARECQPENVVFLLKVGAKRELRDGGGRTAAERAAETAALYKQDLGVVGPDPAVVERCTQVEQLLR
jgi:ankyrin repeat protein